MSSEETKLTDHEILDDVLITKPQDYVGYGNGKVHRDSKQEWLPDCSTGCKWFFPLEGRLGLDWGVCANPLSHRAGLLTFEHQGCPKFEGGDEEIEGSDDEEIEKVVDLSAERYKEFIEFWEQGDVASALKLLLKDTV